VMKGMYGLEVLAKLREMDPGARVVVLSADIQTSSRDLVQAAGASAFLTKPANAQQMLDAVARAAQQGDSWS
jgi:two-component system, chemotaxis family, chemotaxis protein CheY